MEGWSDEGLHPSFQAAPAQVELVLRDAGRERAPRELRRAAERGAHLGALWLARETTQRNLQPCHAVVDRLKRLEHFNTNC